MSTFVQVLGPSRLPTYKDRTNMPYVDAMLHETLRRGTIGMYFIVITTNVTQNNTGMYTKENTKQYQKTIWM